MRIHITSAIPLIILILSTLVIPGCQIEVAHCNEQLDSPTSLNQSCTTFFAFNGDMALLGDSEDMGADHPLASDPERSVIWFYPSSAILGGKYGVLALGWFWNDDVSFQSGMNGKGLGLGLTAIPPTPLNSHPEKPFSPTSHGSLYYRILWDSASVTEAIQIASNYDLEELHYQILIGDASGDAVIISPGSDGELAFTRKEPTEDYLVASTYNCAIPESYIGGDSFKRYDTAVAALENLENSTNSIVDQCSSILESVHRQSSVQLGAYTAYSSIFDLKSRVTYIYYLSQFDEVIELNMDEELIKGQHYYRLSELVPVRTNDQALAQYQAAQTRGWLVISGISIGILMLFIGLTFLIYTKVKKRRK